MSEPDIGGFGKTAKSLSGSPLGIIALFIVLVYGCAALVLGFSGKNLTVALQIPLVAFLVLFPILVLVVFSNLVRKHYTNLYGPSDFKDEKNFMEFVLSDLRVLREFKDLAQPVIEQQIETDDLVELERPHDFAYRRMLWTNMATTERPLDRETADSPRQFSTGHDLNKNEKVLRTLAEGKYTYRTVHGLARELGFSHAEMERLISDLEAKKLVGRMIVGNGPRWYIKQEGRDAMAIIELEVGVRQTGETHAEHGVGPERE